MKYVRLIVTLYIVLFAFTAYAAEKKHAKKLKSQKIGYASTEFDDSLDKLPINFKGNSLVDVITAFEKNEKKFSKDEFETNKQFEERLEKQVKLPLVGKLSYDSRYSFVLPDTEIEKTYNAENGEITVKLKKNPRHAKTLDTEPETHKNAACFEIVANRTNKGGYLGQNSFGAKSSVSSTSKKIYYVGAISGSSMIKSNDPYYNPISLKYKLSLEDAKEAKLNTGVALIGHIASPIIRTALVNFPATIEDPNELTIDYTYLMFKLESIWVYNLQTGVVYAKFPVIDDAATK
jgi:hypothetical protein